MFALIEYEALVSIISDFILSIYEIFGKGQILEHNET